MRELADLARSYSSGQVQGLYRRWCQYRTLDSSVSVLAPHLDALPDDEARDRGLARSLLNTLNYATARSKMSRPDDEEAATPACIAAGALPWSLHQQLDELEGWIKAHYGSVSDEWEFLPRTAHETMPPIVLMGQVFQGLIQHYSADSWVDAFGCFTDDFVRVWPIAVLWIRGWLQRDIETNGGLVDFGSTWCQAGYAQLVVHQPLAAAFALTDVPDSLIPEELPWQAFRILLPKSPVLVHGPNFEGRFDELWLWSTLADGGTTTMWCLGGSLLSTFTNGSVQRNFWVIARGATSLRAVTQTVQRHVSELSKTKRTELVTVASESARALVNILLCVAVQLAERNFERAPAKKAPKGKRWRAPKQQPVTTDYVLGRDIRVTGPNLAPVVEAICRGEKKFGLKQWMVRGHKREQAHGPRHSLRKTIWIQPFWKGPVDAPILKRSHELQEDSHAHDS
jgi:hypothetical protein